MRLLTITPQFVDSIPREIQDGVIYISEKYSTASHNCCCGCGMKVVTSLSPARWKLHREGGLVTLRPSIGNWEFPCRSHYWIRRNHVVWVGAMSHQEIRRVKERDQRDIERHIKQRNEREVVNILNQTNVDRLAKESKGKSVQHGLWHWLKDWWNH